MWYTRGMTQIVTSFFDRSGRALGIEFFLVGGCVRDEIRGVPSNDFDLVARGLDAEDLEAALLTLGRVDRIGDAFEVFALQPDEIEGRFEIALPRTESTTGSGHKGFTPVHDPNLPIEADLKRRDFTVNAIAKNVHTGELVDPLGGVEDIEHEVLRAANLDVFADDPLRILRAVRFIAQHGFFPDSFTETMIIRHAHRLSDLPGERIQAELVKIVTGQWAQDAIEWAQDKGVLPHFLPELSKADGCTQNRHHSYDVLTHTLAVLRNTESDDWEVRLAALFHDIGKPPTKWIDLVVDPTGNPHFYENRDVPGSRDHEIVGAEIAREIMQRLKFSNDQIERVSGFVLLHMFSQDIRNGRPAARRLLKRIKETIPGDIRENVAGLFAIRYGDCMGGKVYADGSIEARELLEALAINGRFERLVLEELANDSALTVKDLAVNGHDLMDIGFEGVGIGIEQKRLLESVLDDPERNNREWLTNAATLEWLSQKGVV